MTDLSYTNKDGLNLYEGFDNGFNYHRDGADSGDGYAHGGYPHIDGETSEYTDTSYKTGDPDDFFGNGNTFNIIPRSGGSGYEFVIKPVSYYGEGSGLLNKITAGQWFPYEEGESYNIEYDGVLYENIKAELVTVIFSNVEAKYFCVGNSETFVNRTNFAEQIPINERRSVIDNGLPFAFIDDITDDDFPNNAQLMFDGLPTTHVATITSVSNPSKTYTIEISVDSDSFSNIYSIPESNETIMHMLETEDGKPQNIIVGDITYSGKWKFDDTYGPSYGVILDDYEYDEQPADFFLGSNDIIETGRNYADLYFEQISSDVQVTIPKM